MSDIQEIRLIIEGQTFKVYRNVLCEHSDYFAAMFSGNYVEKEKSDITINVVDAESMGIILRYINVGLIDLSEFSLQSIGRLAEASNFLQMRELNKQITYWLDLQLTESNCIEIMMIAERASYLRLEQLAGSYALLTFKTMKPEYIPNVQKLFWYLSHPYLDTLSELDVFKFGYKWILHPQTCVYAELLLILIGCIDMKRLTCFDLKEIMLLVDHCENSLAEKVLECLKMLFDNKFPITLEVLQKHGRTICENFTESVFAEVLNLVRNSNQRKLKYTPIAAVWKYNNGDLAFVPHDLHAFTLEKGFQKWLEVADKNMWGWNMAAWGATRIVLACGEYGRGLGKFMTDVKVYDTLRKQWTQHGVKLPSRRHAGVTVLGDTLFIVGGVGTFRVIEDTTIIYDLRNRSYRKAANFPEVIQSPAICTHYGAVYAAGHRNVYKFVDTGEKEMWVPVVKTEIRATSMISYKDYIYCSQIYFTYLHRFRPGIDDKLEFVTHFSTVPVSYCDMGDHMMAFCRAVSGATNDITVELYKGPCKCPIDALIGRAERPGCSCLEVAWRCDDSDVTVNDVAGTCALVMGMPKVTILPSNYHQKYVTQFGAITYSMGVDELSEET